MPRPTLYRNVHARDLLDAFLVSAVVTVLLVRFYLHITGYPQIGGGSLHIAHLLYGGVLMLVAIVVTLAFLGTKARKVSAVVGGIGFGLFIDEIGKFITEDNDYFFQPAIGIIYAIFVVLYLGFNFLTRKERLTSREYQINVLSELEEAIANDLDRSERAHIYHLLNSSDQKSALTKHLRELVDAVRVTVPVKESITRKAIHCVDKMYTRFWKQRSSRWLVKSVFVAEIVVLASGVVFTIYTNIGDIEALFNGSTSYSREVLIGQIASSVVAGGFTIYGLTLLTSSRYLAFEQLRRATLINIYLTQFFIFVRLQFDALPGLILNVILLLLITFVLRQERRLGDPNDFSK